MTRNKTVRRAVGAAAIGAVGLVAGLSAGPVSAETVEIPVGDVYLFGDPGSSAQIGSSAVDADLVGRTCTVVAEVTNISSVNPGNKLVVTSGGSTVEIGGIEDSPDGVVTQGGSLTLGESIDVSVVFGEEGASSLGSSLTLTCEALPPAPPAPPVAGDPPYTG